MSMSLVSMNAFLEAARSEGRGTSEDQLGIATIRCNFREALLRDLSFTATALNKTWYPHLTWGDAAAMTGGATEHLDDHTKQHAVLYFSPAPTHGDDERAWLEIDAARKKQAATPQVAARLTFYMRTYSDFLGHAKFTCTQELAGNTRLVTDKNMGAYHEHAGEISTILKDWLKGTFTDRTFLAETRKNARMLLGHQIESPRGQQPSFAFPPLR